MTAEADDPAAALLALVADEQGLSVARACKRLGLARSQLQRLLASLGDAGLLERRDEGDRATLWLGPSLRTGAPAAPLVRRSATRLDAEGGTLEREEWLAEETAVALLFNGVPHVVMMATPADLEDFALGFALTEDIVASADELQLIDALPRPDGIALHLSIPAARFERLQLRRRNLVGRSGCGLCGAETLAEAIAPVRRVARAVVPGAGRLLAAFAALQQAQPLNRACGALHAAAALRGEALQVREDVGRHNALDKVVGALARAGVAADALLVTSRASYELVHKAAQAGVGTLAAVSAPTAHAVRLAQQAQLALYGFARGDRITRYA